MFLTTNIATLIEGGSEEAALDRLRALLNDGRTDSFEGKQYYLDIFNNVIMPLEPPYLRIFPKPFAKVLDAMLVLQVPDTSNFI